jgi:general secretion pathway protein F
MADFEYRAVGPDGKIVVGRLDAPRREDALRQLAVRRFTPLELAERGADDRIDSGTVAAKGSPGTEDRQSSIFSRDKGPVFADILSLTGELAVMLCAGLPLDRALRVLKSMTSKASVVRLIDDLLRSVKGGKGLSEALDPHRAIFGDFYVNIVRAGEAGGQLGPALKQLAEHLERVKMLREKVVSALIYPAILVGISFISVILLLGFVVPKFETLFEDLGEGLPMATRLIVASGHFVVDWGWFAVGLIGLAVWFARLWLRSEQGRRRRDAFLLTLPLVGDVVKRYELAQFARSMATLLKNGVPLVTAMRIATDTIGNRVLQDAMAKVSPAVKQGVRIGDAIDRIGFFTPLALNMVRLGEETGRLDEMLREVARIHDGEVESGVKRFLTLLEPILIMVLGFVIAAIIVAILMGILSVNELAM